MSQRKGVIAGAAAYLLWGIFPLVFRLLDDVAAGEILFHRILWSFVVVVAILAVRRDRHWFDPVRALPTAIPRLAVAAVLLATNWLVYIWAVNHGHVLEGALGYYIGPLITVALGVLVLGERLRRAQVLALCFGLAAVVVLTFGYGRIPWIALVLASSFAGYSFAKKSVSVGAIASLAVETTVLLPIALGGLTVLFLRGDAAFLDGGHGRDLLLIGLGVVTIVPLLLFGIAAPRIPLSLLGLLQYLTPTFQLLCGVLILEEDLPPERLAGFALVWVALGVLAVDALRNTRRSVPVVEPA